MVALIPVISWLKIWDNAYRLWFGDSQIVLYIIVVNKLAHARYIEHLVIYYYNINYRLSNYGCYSPYLPDSIAGGDTAIFTIGWGSF